MSCDLLIIQKSDCEGPGCWVGPVGKSKMIQRGTEMASGLPSECDVCELISVRAEDKPGDPVLNISPLACGEEKGTFAAPSLLFLLLWVNLESRSLRAVFGELWRHCYSGVVCRMPQTEWKEIESCKECSFSGKRMASNVIQILGSPMVAKG